MSLNLDPGRAWQPGLAKELVAAFAQTHATYRAADYGSAAWLGLDRAAGQQGGSVAALNINAAAMLQTGSVAALNAIVPANSCTALIPGLPHAHFEILRGRTRERYAALGLTLTNAVPGERAAALFDDALDLLADGPGLREAVEALVQRVHPLVPRGPGYDSSHSDPELPFSIFVSIPDREPAAALRLAESILHEAMHLQLSLFEAREPLVRQPQPNERAATGYSPWQNTERPIGGLVHGLFVFRVIFDWLGELSANRPHDREIAGYAARRRSEIGQEVANVGDLAASPALTTPGKRLVSEWLAGIRVRQAGQC